MTALNGWENFYVIVGSSAGALIGLQFVVITLIAERPIQGMAQASGAFASPSIVHFAVVLLLSAIVSAPWNGMAIVALLWGLLGICGVVYTAIIVVRMRRQTAYQPVFEDWMFHFLLPLIAYAVLVVSAYLAQSHARPSMFFVGSASLLLLFIGIHNAWDAVTYYVFVATKKEK